MRENRGRKHPTTGSIIKCPSLRLNQSKVKSQELHPNLPEVWQDTSPCTILYCFPKYINSQLNGGCQHSKQHSNMRCEHSKLQLNMLRCNAYHTLNYFTQVTHPSQQGGRCLYHPHFIRSCNKCLNAWLHVQFYTHRNDSNPCI